MGNLDQAIKLYEQVVALDPLSANSYARLGYLLYLAARYDEARVTLQKARDLNPQSTGVHLTTGKILVAEGILSRRSWKLRRNQAPGAN